MVKNEFITRMAAECECTKKDAEAFFDGFTKVLAEVLSEGEKVRLTDIGTLQVAIRSARTCTNPQTGKKMTVPEKKCVRFKASKVLNEKVNS